MWENSREYEQYGSLIARNRKLIKESIENITKGKRNEVTFEEAKSAMLGLLRHHFKDYSDDKLKCVLRVAEIQGASELGPGNAYDVQRILEVFKNRHAGP